MKHSEEEILEALQGEDGYESAAPDCRQAVMARIASPRWTLRPVWAFACAVALIAVVAAGVMMNRPGPTEPVKQIARQERVVPRPVAPERVVKAPAPAPQAIIAPAPKTSPRLTRAIQPRPHRRYAPVPRPRTIAPAPEPALQASNAPVPSLNPQPSTLNPEDRPVAAVMVSWPEPAEGTDASYHYVERDAATGVVTSCSVRRTGDSVEIYVESTSGDEKPAPVKGSIENEKPNSA